MHYSYSCQIDFLPVSCIWTVINFEIKIAEAQIGASFYPLHGLHLPVTSGILDRGLLLFG